MLDVFVSENVDFIVFISTLGNHQGIMHQAFICTYYVTLSQMLQIK